MKTWLDILLESKIDMNKLLEDVRYEVKSIEKPTNEGLFQIKVINKLKEKRSRTSNKKFKKDLQGLIDQLEIEYRKINKDY